MTITRRLLVINGLICVAFVVITLVVVLSFRQVRTALTTIFSRETHRIVQNANATRELSRILSDLNLVLMTFHERETVLRNLRAPLLSAIDALGKTAEQPELKAALGEFRQRVDKTLIQCNAVIVSRDAINAVENQFEDLLALLDQLVAERLVELIVRGEETTNLRQISSLVGGYRESFMEVRLRLMQLGLEDFKAPIDTRDHPLFSLLADLRLRLRALTASAPAIAGHGRQLIELVEAYRRTLTAFNAEVMDLSAMMSDTNHQRERLMMIMEKADRAIAGKTAEAAAILTARIDRSLTINLAIFLMALPAVVLAGLTALSIRAPVRLVIDYVDRIARGEIPEPVQKPLKGEFARVGENLNALIDATLRVTTVAEEIASGRVQRAVPERSEKDRLMQALNSMIRSLGRLQRETDGMIHAVGMGGLTVRGDASGFQGGWRDLVAGLNALIEGLSASIARSAALAQEMELARRIQTSLAPVDVSRVHPDFTIAAGMIPADQVGGDFYDITFDRSGNPWLAIGDVSGHGLTPGLIMMMAQTIHATVTTQMDCDARRAVATLNAVLYQNVRERLGETHFMTLTALKYLGGGRFQHAGAHLSMIVHRQGAGVCELIRTRGVYLNLKKDIAGATRNAEFRLLPGDRLVLYTDGLTEARSPSGEMLDIDRFMDIVAGHAGRDVEAMKDGIMADVIRWCDNRRLDDMSLVIVKMKGESA